MTPTTTFCAPAINRLRDHLMELSTHSIPPQHGALRAESASPEERALMRRFRPFAELFYMVAAADGQVDEDEQSLILGAFRALTGGAVRRERLEELCRDLEEMRASQGWEDRLEAVCSELAQDHQDAELAFTLASAVALADDRVTENEEELLMTLGDWLNIRNSRSKILIEESKPSGETESVSKLRGSVNVPPEENWKVR